MHSYLHALRLAAFDAGKTYHTAGTRYFGAVSARSTDRDISQALEQCIFVGEQYRTALTMYLDELQNVETNAEVDDATGRAERLLELLVVELQKFFALRGERRF